jgi:hypothetical protein
VGRRREELAGQAEILRVVAQEHAELPWPVAADAAAGDDAREGDRHAAGLLLSEQAGPVPPGVLPGQVPHLQPVNPHRHRAGVIGIVIFGD